MKISVFALHGTRNPAVARRTKEKLPIKNQLREGFII